MKDYNGNEIGCTMWQACTPFTCQECNETFWIYYDGSIKKLNLVFCNTCFENENEGKKLTFAGFMELKISQHRLAGHDAIVSLLSLLLAEYQNQ